MNNLIIRAAQFAADKHRDQFRKYNGLPFITHPIRVAGRLATVAIATEELVAAGYLHDVIEDCDVTFLDIAKEFGSGVAQLVQHVTNTSKQTGLPRADRKRIDRERVAKIPRECKVMKLIDRIDNLNEIDRNDSFAKLYAEESLLLVEVLRDADDELADELVETANAILEYVSAIGDNLMDTMDTTECNSQNCTCHERDSSYVCPVCFAAGRRGHM